MTAPTYRAVVHVTKRSPDGQRVRVTLAPLPPRGTRAEAREDLRRALWDRKEPRAANEIGRSGSIETVIS